MTKPSSHYSPFGSLIPNRSWSDASREYRYGFNGKEKDFETANDNYDFGARIYDGRLGRWLSLDKLFKLYPEFSPYSYCINNPLQYVEFMGLGFNGGFSVKNQSTSPIVIKGSSAKITPKGMSGTTTNGGLAQSSTSLPVVETKEVNNEITLQPGQRLETYTKEIKNSDGTITTYYTSRVVQFAELKDGKLVNLENEYTVNEDAGIWDTDAIVVQDNQTFIDDDGNRMNTDVNDKNAKTPNPGTGKGTIKLKCSYWDFYLDKSDANEGEVTITGDKDALEVKTTGDWENNPTIDYGKPISH